MKLLFFFYIGVTSTAQNGFSQAASSQLPTGTWENGIFDYDHLKRSFLATYTRHWDDASKVPFLFNPSTQIWISYDDLESISIKNNYIKREQLGGAMFWELSGDRSSELVGATFAALYNGQTPPTVSSTTVSPFSTTQTNVPISTTTQAVTPTSTIFVSTTETTNGNDPEWQPHRSYRIGDRVTYTKITYRCVQAHTSLPDWTPAAVPALWQRI